MEMPKFAGYNGSFSLELYPDRFPDSGPVQELLFASIDILRAAGD